MCQQHPELCLTAIRLPTGKWEWLSWNGTDWSIDHFASLQSPPDESHEGTKPSRTEQELPSFR